MKTIEQACQDAICHLQKRRVNDRILERCTESFYAGAEFERKNNEEKLRWIPVEEKLPENKELVLVKTNRNCVSTAYLHGKLSGFITYGEEAFVDFGSITHWRSIFL